MDCNPPGIGLALRFVPVCVAMPELMLSDDQLRLFGENGYLILPNLADPALCDEIVRFAAHELAREAMPIEFEADTQYPGAPTSRQAEGGRTARRLLQAYGRSPLIASWATGAALALPLKQLLGPRTYLVQAHHNCIMTKQPRFSSLTGWHRDIRYWHFERPELISAWLALGQETPENGCLSVIPGSHRVTISAAQLDQAQFLRADLTENRNLIEQAVPVPLNKGDVLLFHSNLFHCAGNNRTVQNKLSLVFTYRAGDNSAVAGSRSASLPDIPL